MSESDEQPVLAEVLTDGPAGDPAASGLEPQPPVPIFDAQLVDAGSPPPAAAHPLRFGLKTLLALTAVCCGQFAFMSYVGTLPGLLLTALLCGVGLAGLLCGPAFLRRTHRAVWMERFDRVAIRLTLAIVILLAGALLTGGGLALHQQVQSLRLASKVHRHLGFSGREEMILKTEDGGHQVGRDAIYIRNVTPGGAFHQAGFLQGDVILSDLSPRAYYQMLDENRGGSVTVQVASGAVGSVLTPVETCPQRTLDLQIPP